MGGSVVAAGDQPDVFRAAMNYSKSKTLSAIAGGGGMDFPAKVSSPTVFRCVWVSPMDDAVDEFSYQTSANIIRIMKQLHYFEQYQQRLSLLIGPQKTQRLVNEALVLTTLSGNNFINNYNLVPYSARS
ncbi:Lipase, GDSL [Canna indica]|uniref:Lipase, GDSL n=1 Tax=Canna indica TaxID=4628 RepID=A0AAQ3KZW0_9LILI|nr:Lipase, GDSL [Canna indica]